MVESVAENTTDAVVAPLVWGALAGLPGLLGYRAVNTLDAMVGHRSARLRAVRLGLGPARRPGQPGAVPADRGAHRICRRWSAVTRGPHCARAPGRRGTRARTPACEAAIAGALGLRLGGINGYDGVAERRPLLGDGRAADARDIRRAARLSGAVTLTAAAVAAAVSLAGERR